MVATKYAVRRGSELETVGRLIGVIDAILRSSFHRLHPILEEHGLTMGQFQTLHAVSSLEHASVGAVAHNLGVSSPAVCVTVDGLEEARLVRRHRSARDARTVELSVTTRGQKVETRVWNDLARAISFTVRGLPAADLTTALVVFEEIVRRFETYAAARRMTKPWAAEPDGSRPRKPHGTP